MDLLPRLEGVVSLTRCLRVVCVLSLVAVVAHAHAQVVERKAFDRSLAQVPVVAPAGTPPVTQESIDLALVLYGIDVPASADRPQLDLELHDRGLTARGAFMDKARVTIGPAAFASWALLGSTLAHELEVHCQQNFLTIYLMDSLGLDGTGAAERQAYVHELESAERFGTAREDTQMIAETVQFYYPEHNQGSVQNLPRSLRTWLARTLLIPPKRLF